MSSDKVYTLKEIEDIVKPLAKEYGVEAIYLFGSYARGTATAESDIDLIVFGGAGFRLPMVYALGEDLRDALQKDIDIFEIHEINVESDFYKNVMKERTQVA